MAHVEDRLWSPYEEGSNPGAPYMAHLREPLRALPKPLAWYLLAEGLAGVKHAVLTAAGFACRRHAGFSYYTLNTPPHGAAACEGDDERATPIFFAHGVGLGLLPYLQFVLKLAALGRPVIAIEYPHLAMRWSQFIPTVDQGVDAMLGILAHHGYRQAAWVGHSFGTFFLSRLNRRAPGAVACMALIDPVCMCMWSGHLVKSFVYTPHHNKSGLMTWFISRDIHTAAAVARHFYWTEYNMWPDLVGFFVRAVCGLGVAVSVCFGPEVPPSPSLRHRARPSPPSPHPQTNTHQFPDNALVVVSGQDDLVPAGHVESMVLQETDARFMMIPDEKHAAFLFNQPWQEEVVSGVWGLIDDTTSGGNGGGGGGKQQGRRAAAGGVQTRRAKAAAAAAAAGSSGDLSPSGSSPDYSSSAARPRGGRGHKHSDSAFSLAFSASASASGSDLGGVSGSNSDAGDAPLDASGRLVILKDDDSSFSPEGVSDQLHRRSATPASATPAKGLAGVAASLTGLAASLTGPAAAAKQGRSFKLLPGSGDARPKAA